MKYIHICSSESDFVVDLAQPITAARELGIAEFSIRNDFQPTLPPFNGLLWQFLDEKVSSSIEAGSNHYYYYPNANYYNFKSLIDRINRTQEKAYINQLESSKALLVIPPYETGAFPNFKKNPKRIRNPVFVYGKLKKRNLAEGKYLTSEISLRKSITPITNLLVYTDLIRPQTVGDTEVPLLRNIPVTSAVDEYQHHIFEKIYFFPVITEYANRIRISIKSDTAKAINLNGSMIHITLALRHHEDTLLL